MPDPPAVHVKGLAEFRRDVKRVDAEVNKQLARDLREGAQETLEEGRAVAPRLTGKLAGSLRLSVTTRQVAIYSNLPYAGLLHWGGTIRPRGVPITFKRTEFLSDPVERNADKIAERVAESVEDAARATGWH